MNLLGKTPLVVLWPVAQGWLRTASSQGPMLPFMCLLAVAPGNAGLLVSGSQALPAAGRNTPHDVASASGSSAVDASARDRCAEQQDFCLWGSSERLAFSETGIRKTLIFMGGPYRNPELWVTHPIRANKPMPCLLAGPPQGVCRGQCQHQGKISFSESLSSE